MYLQAAQREHLHHVPQEPSAPHNDRCMQHTAQGSISKGMYTKKDIDL